MLPNASTLHPFFQEEHLAAGKCLLHRLAIQRDNAVQLEKFDRKPPLFQVLLAFGGKGEDTAIGHKAHSGVLVSVNAVGRVVLLK